MKKKEWIPYLIAILALILGACYDYQITDALYHKNIIAMLFERLGPLFIQMMVVITMCMLHRMYLHRTYLVLAWGVGVYAIQDLVHYMISISIWVFVGCMLISFLMTWMLWWIIKRIPPTILQKRVGFFVFFTCVTITAILITFLMKNMWGRIRYRDMKDVAEFCVWYRPCGLYGNHSFPSGHTTAFTAILCFLQWKDHPAQKTSVFRYLIITCLIIMMPLTRMMMGAHFLSDTAMGFIITYSCYLGYRHIFLRGGKLI